MFTNLTAAPRLGQPEWRTLTVASSCPGRKTLPAVRENTIHPIETVED